MSYEKIKNIMATYNTGSILTWKEWESFFKEVVFKLRSKG